MGHYRLPLAAAAAIALAASGSAMAKPPGSVTVGPPAIPKGPPPGVGRAPTAVTAVPTAATVRVPQGRANGHGSAALAKPVATGKSATAPGLAKVPKDVAKGASLLKKLNAAHASDRALERASDKSIVGAIGEYKTNTKEALADIETFTDLVEAGTIKVNELTQDLADAQTAVNTAQSAVDAAQAKLDAANAANPVDPAAVQAATTELTAANTQLTEATNAYNSVNTELATATTALDADKASLAAAEADLAGAQTALADKSGVELTPEVVERLNDLLDL